MSFIRNSAFNFLGGLVPAIASLLTVPVIVHRLGEVQYGVFALVTSIVGYFAILDFNVTAGSVKYVAQYHANRDTRRMCQALTFGAAIYVGIGLAGALGISVFAELLARQVFKVPADLQALTVTALYWAAAAFLFGQLQAFLQSVPQSLQRYDVSGKLESVFGALVPLSTVVVVLAGGGLADIMIARLVLSVINCGVLVGVVRRLLPEMRLVAPDRSIAASLASFSAYSYLSRLAAISYLNSDKLLIAAMVDMRALAFYTVPFLLANRVFGMAYRVAQVIFPISSALAAQGKLAELRDSYLAATRFVVYLNACLCVMLFVFSRELLHYWAGRAFGADASLVLQLLAIAVFVDSLTNLPSLVNDGLGKPKYTGIVAVLRAAIGLAAAFFAITHFGFLGAAWAQLSVSIVATIGFLIFIHGRHVPVPLVAVLKQMGPSWPPLVVICTAGFLLHGREPMPLAQFGILATGVAGMLGAWGWWVVLDRPQQHKVLERCRHLAAPRV